jgi:hypothetical protein
VRAQSAGPDLVVAELGGMRAARSCQTKIPHIVIFGSCDLWKLRAKGLAAKVPHSRRYCIQREGYSICLIFLKLFERICPPLTAALLQPFSGDGKLQA